jgi:hypothetical protein
MQKKMLLIGTLGLVVVSTIIGIFYVNSFRPDTFEGERNVVPISTIAILFAEVSEKTIDLGITFTTSYGSYRSYATNFQDGKLFVTLLHSGEKDITTPILSIPNTFGTIHAVYLKGNSSEQDVLVWPKNISNPTGIHKAAIVPR